MPRFCLLCCLEEIDEDNVRRWGDCPRLRMGGVGGTSPVKRTSVSMYLHSILSAATGERTKMSSSSGVIPSSGGGDRMEGTTPGSFAGLGLAGGSEGVWHVFVSSCADLGEPCGGPIVISLLSYRVLVIYKDCKDVFVGCSSVCVGEVSNVWPATSSSAVQRRQSQMFLVVALLLNRSCAPLIRRVTEAWYPSSAPEMVEEEDLDV